MERIFCREHAEAAPVLEIFRYQAFRADLDGCLDDQSGPEGEGVLFFKSARGDYELRFGGLPVHRSCDGDSRSLRLDRDGSKRIRGRA
jgi:hypothetical protein